MLLPAIQRVLPAAVKNRLKPWYRTVFPNRLHVLWWPTFRCNYRCSYCPVVTQFDYMSVFPRGVERSADDWVVALQQLPPALIYISGGEPFVFKGLPHAVNNLGKHSLLGIVTNATAPVRIYEQITRRIHLNVSFHREFTDEASFLERVTALQRRHQVQVNIVATPENLPLIDRLSADFRARRIDLHVDPFVDPAYTYSAAERALLDRVLQSDRASHVDRQLNFQDYAPKTCSAGRNYLNILPNGDVYTCIGGAHYIHSPLVREMVARAPEAQDLDAFRMGNLFEGTFRLRTAPVRCVLPCTSACDFDAAIIKRDPR